jgi:hypothetical protein
MYFSTCNQHLGTIYANQPDYTTLYHPFNTCAVEGALPIAVLEAIALMRTNPGSFLNTDAIFFTPLMIAAKCGTCTQQLLEWKKTIAAGMDSVPKFSTFI